VRAKDLIDLLENFEENGSYETRMRLQSTALNIAGFAQGKAWIEANPFSRHRLRQCVHLPRRTNRVRQSSRPNLSDSCYGDVAAYSGRQGNVVGKALVLLTLTFVRPGTVTQAEWDEFDLAGALWTVPFKKLKQRKFREGIDDLRASRTLCRCRARRWCSCAT